MLKACSSFDFAAGLTNLIGCGTRCGLSMAVLRAAATTVYRACTCGYFFALFSPIRRNINWMNVNPVVLARVLDTAFVRYPYRFFRDQWVLQFFSLLPSTYLAAERRATMSDAKSRAREGKIRGNEDSASSVPTGRKRYEKKKIDFQRFTSGVGREKDLLLLVFVLLNRKIDYLSLSHFLKKLRSWSLIYII